MCGMFPEIIAPQPYVPGVTSDKAKHTTHQQTNQLNISQWLTKSDLFTDRSFWLFNNSGNT